MVQELQLLPVTVLSLKNTEGSRALQSDELPSLNGPHLAKCVPSSLMVTSVVQLIITDTSMSTC